jgi:hypothetical protein
MLDTPAPTSPALPLAETQPTVPVWPTAGHALGLSRAATYAGIHTGAIPSIRIGKRIVVPTAALRRMLELDGAA